MPQLVRFILIGLLATGVHYGLLRLLVDVAQVPSAGSTVGTGAPSPGSCPVIGEAFATS